MSKNLYESLEEAAESYASKQSDTKMRNSPIEFSKSGQELWEESKADFKAGAGWQAERVSNTKRSLKFSEKLIIYINKLINFLNKEL